VTFDREKARTTRLEREVAVLKVSIQIGLQAQSDAKKGLTQLQGSRVSLGAKLRWNDNGMRPAPKGNELI
jgi:hypothetical protein